MKIRFLLPFVLLLGACAGNPPQWWNPSGSYDKEATKQPAKPAATSKAADQSTSDDLMLVEQNIDSVEESYEEMDLTEKPATTAEGEEVSAASESNIAVSEENTAAQQPPQVEEHLPEDGSLPPPSVLQ